MDYKLDPRSLKDWDMLVQDAVYSDWGTVKVIEELKVYGFWDLEELDPNFNANVMCENDLRARLYDYIINDEERMREGL